MVVAGRPALRRQPRAATDGHHGLTRARVAGLAGIGAVRPARRRHRRARSRRGLLAAAVGEGVRRLRPPRQACLPPRPRPEVAALRRLGRAWRRPRDRPRQLGPPLPPHLGHRPRGRADLRRAGRAGRGGRARPVRVPPPGRRGRRRGRRRRGRTRHRPGRRRVRPRREVHPRGRRRVRAPRRRRRRDERRHRPQPRADAPQLADRAGRRSARAHDLRRARPRRRPDAGHRRGRRRHDGQQGPDVGLRRGHPQLGPGLARPRDPDPARVRRRCGSTRPAGGSRACPASREPTRSAR